MKRLMIAAAFITTPVAALAIPTMMPASGQPGNVPIDFAAIDSGIYETDPSHTLISWRVSHFGFNDYFGLFGDAEGTLNLDTENIEDSTVSVSIPIASLSVVSDDLAKHMLTDDFFMDEAHPDAKFQSTDVKLTGATTADITGDLTLNGSTKPVTLIAEFTGTGTNPMNKKNTIGFEATALIKRSDFGIDYAIPNVSDEIVLNISVAFEK